MSVEDRPNFMVVGAAKSGTTSCYFLLRRHPEVFAPSKETYFVTPRSAAEVGITPRFTEVSAYRQFFHQGAQPNAKAWGEVSSSYLYTHDEAADAIRNQLGDIRIVIMLRNPVDRAFSNYMYFARDQRDKRTFEEAIDEETNQGKDKLPWPLHYVAMGFYTAQVKAYLDRFSRVHIILFDAFRDDTQGKMANLFTFLGVDSGVDLGTMEEHNVSGTPKFPRLHRLLFYPTPTKLFIKSLLIKFLFSEEQIAGVVEKLRRKNLKKVRMQDATRRRLMDHYRPDIESLQDLLGRDLSHWME